MLLNVETIVNYFDSSDMKDYMANIILGNSELQTALHYNNPSQPMNYGVLAYVAVMAFAKHLWDSYVAPVSWLIFAQ